MNRGFLFEVNKDGKTFEAYAYFESEKEATDAVKKHFQLKKKSSLKVLRSLPGRYFHNSHIAYGSVDEIAK
jgi:hypothetical protein